MNKKATLLMLILIFTLAGCKSYNVETDLSAEDVEVYQNQIEELSQKIAEDNEVTIADYAEKARAESLLGMNNKAIKTLKKAEKRYKTSTVAWHNLAKIYDNAHNCKKAEVYYNKLITEANMPNYYYDIAYCYVRAKGDKEIVNQNYAKYLLLAKGAPDSEIEEYIKN